MGLVIVMVMVSMVMVSVMMGIVEQYVFFVCDRYGRKVPRKAVVL